MESDSSSDIVSSIPAKGRRGKKKYGHNNVDKHTASKTKFDATAGSVPLIIAVSFTMPYMDTIYLVTDLLGVLLEKTRKREGEGYRKTIADLKHSIKNLKAEVYDATEQQEENQKTSGDRSVKCDRCAGYAPYVNGGIMEENLVVLQLTHAELISAHEELKRKHTTLESVSQEQRSQLVRAKASLENVSKEAQAAQDALELLKSDNDMLKKQIATLSAEIEAQASLHKSQQYLSAMFAKHFPEQFRSIEQLSKQVEWPEKVGGELNVPLPAMPAACLPTFLTPLPDGVREGTLVTAGVASAESTGACDTFPTPSTSLPAESLPECALETKNTSPKIVVSNFPPVVEPEFFLASLQSFCNVINFVPLSRTRFVAELDNAEHADFAVEVFHGHLFSGFKLECEYYQGDVPQIGLSTVVYSRHATASAGDPTASATVTLANDPNRHQRCVYVLHHAPDEHKLSLEGIRRLLSRYGAMVIVRKVGTSDIYFAEFIAKIGADKAVQSFPQFIDGYQFSCKRNHHQLPKVNTPISASDAKQGAKQGRKGNSDNSRRVTPAAPPPPPLTVPEAYRGASKKLFCARCKEAGRSTSAYTHNQDQCGYMPDKKARGSQRDRSESSERSPRTKSSGGRRDRSRDRRVSDDERSRDYDRRRGRSASPDRFSRSNNSTRSDYDRRGSNRDNGSEYARKIIQRGIDRPDRSSSKDWRKRDRSRDRSDSRDRSSRRANYDDTRSTSHRDKYASDDDDRSVSSDDSRIVRKRIHH